MNNLRMLFISIMATNLLVAGTANAGLVNYEISGDVAGSFRAILDDPIADLLSVTRNADHNLPFNLILTIDTDNQPYIENNTSTFQEVIYRDAIVSATLDLNGAVFETQRRPQPSPVENPPTSEESRISVVNRISPTSPDAFGITLNQEPLPTSDLFNSYSVPFNQTINGTFFADSNVQLNIIGFLIPSAPGLFENYSLPDQDGMLTPVPFGSSLTLQFRTDTGGPFQLGSISGLGSNYTFDISPVAVPLPSAIWFFIFGTGLLGLVKRVAYIKTRY